MSLEQTQQRRQAIHTIHDIVSALRAIAAGRIQSAQRALACARRYQDVVIRSLVALRTLQPIWPLYPAAGQATALVVLTSEQPLCGAFNQNVLSLAERRWQELRGQTNVRLVVVGQRGQRQLAARGIAPDIMEPAATTLPGVRDLVKRLATRLDQGVAAGEFASLRVIYNRYQSVSEQIPTEEQILPLDLAAIPPAPAAPARRYQHYLSLPVLLAGLISQYALISLYRTAADSYASEQASRLVAMDGATRSSERMLRSLLELERRERQDQITRQVLELVAARFTVE